MYIPSANIDTVDKLRSCEERRRNQCRADVLKKDDARQKYDGEPNRQLKGIKENIDIETGWKIIEKRMMEAVKKVVGTKKKDQGERNALTKIAR